MVLNHKEALQYIAYKQKQLIHPLRISTIEDIHSVLIKDLDVEKNIRSRLVGITGNALLMGSNNCPLTYRSIDPLNYKKAMLLFYEQNSLSMFKDLFIDQYDFAVNNYFLASS